MSRLRGALKPILFVVIFAGIAYFFVRAFQQNWESLRAHPLELHYPRLATAAVFGIFGSLWSTYGWHLSMNALSKREKLTFLESVAALNVSGLSKYLPGKIWSYGLQMYWLSQRGFPKSQVLYGNLINLYIAMATAVILGLGLLLISPTQIPRVLILSTLAAVLAVALLSMRLYSTVIRGLMALLASRFNREIPRFSVSPGLMLKLYAVHVASNLAWAIAVLFVCWGTGYRLQVSESALVIGAGLIADAIAFLVIVVPGGLGVREAIMYLILGGSAAGSLALIVPLASRSVMMFVDIVLGSIALSLMRRLKGTLPTARASVEDENARAREGA